jgi:hypothetical protein
VSIHQEFIIFQQLKCAIKTFDNLINTLIFSIMQLPYCRQNYLCSTIDFGSCVCFISSNSRINSKWFGFCFKFVWSSKLSNWYDVFDVADHWKEMDYRVHFHMIWQAFQIWKFCKRFEHVHKFSSCCWIVKFNIHHEPIVTILTYKTSNFHTLTLQIYENATN